MVLKLFGLTDAEEDDYGIEPWSFDTDDDGLPDDWEVYFAETDPLFADGDYAACGDMMAYQEIVSKIITVFDTRTGSDKKTDYVLLSDVVPVVGDDAFGLELRAIWEYGDRFAMGTNVTLVAEEGATNRILAVREGSVALMHALVYQWNGFDSKTAVPSSDAVNTKPFTALDKYLLGSYFQALGVTNSVANKDFWDNWTLKPGVLDCDFDGIADGWELYVMFGPCWCGSAATTSDIKISPWRYEDRNECHSGDGIILRDKYFDESGKVSTRDPWTKTGLALNEKVGNEVWTFRIDGDGVVIGNDGKIAVTGNTNGSLVVPEQLGCKKVVGIDEGAFVGLAGIRSVMIPPNIATIGRGAFAGCVGLDTIKVATGDADRVRQLVADSGLDVSWVEFREKDAGAGAAGLTDTVCLTITNVVVNYIVNSVQPSLALPATYDTGFVNIIAEVKGGCVVVPATWTVNYPKFTEKFGSDFTKALAMKTGKKDGAGNDMFVWQDYVAGTDPTKEDDVFTASITIVDGEVKVSYTPELDDARKALRKYTTWGKAKLTDKDWSVVGEGEEGNFNFFKVTVEMK